MKPRNTAYSFNAKSLEQDILVFCPITGICSRLETVWLPIHLTQEHPLADWRNAIACLDSLADTNRWNRAPEQMLAGCVLSLLKQKDKVTDFPNSSAAEANMMLQGAGHGLLVKLLQTINSRWQSDATWLRVPKLSFDLTAYQYPEVSMSAAVSRLERIIRKALMQDELPKADTAEVYKAFKENSQKSANRQAKTRGQQWADGIVVHSLAAVKEQTIERQITTAKILAKNLAPKMPNYLMQIVKRTADNLSVFGMEHRQELATKLRILFMGTEQQEQANSLAFIFENAEAAVLDEDIAGFSETVVPTNKTFKSFAEILAEKKLAEKSLKGESV